MIDEFIFKCYHTYINSKYTYEYVEQVYLLVQT